MVVEGNKQAFTNCSPGDLRISNTSGPPVTWFQNPRRVSDFGCYSLP